MLLNERQKYTLRALLQPILEDLAKITDKSILKKALQIMETQELDFINAVALSNWKSNNGKHSILVTIRDIIEGVFVSLHDHHQIKIAEVTKYFNKAIKDFIKSQHLEEIEAADLPSLTVDAIASYKADIESFSASDNLREAFREHLKICDAVVKGGLDSIWDTIGRVTLHSVLERFLINLPAKDLVGKVDINQGNKPANKALLIAALNGDLKTVEREIELGADKEATDNQGMTALMIAALYGRVEIVKRLIELGADKEAIDNEGSTALIIAAEYGELEIVSRLIELGADKEAKDNQGMTALMWASVKGDLKIVGKLIELDADKEATDNDGSTALMWAAISEKLEIVEKLIELGADKEATDNDRSTALMWAVYHRHIETVKRLIELGANIEATDSEGRTALIIAAQKGYLEIVEKLIDLGANIEAKNNQGITALMWAALKGNLKIVKRLIDSGADREARDNEGNTALMWAAVYEKLEVIEQLIELGADKEATDNEGITALMWVALKGNLEIVKRLIELGANIEATDNDGSTALMWAAISEKLEIVEELIELDADKEATDNDGSTALMWAVYHRHIETVKRLIELGANIEATDNEGRTALIIAAQKGYLEIVEKLIDLGANIEATDNKARTALIIAAIKGHIEVVEYLMDKVQDEEASVPSSNKPALLCIMATDSDENLIAIERFGSGLRLIGQEFIDSYTKLIAIEYDIRNTNNIDYSALAFSAQQGLRFFPTINYFFKIFGINIPNINFSPEVKGLLDLTLGTIKINTLDKSLILGQMVESGSYYASLKTIEIIHERPTHQKPTDLISLFEICIPELANGLAVGISLMSPAFIVNGLISGAAQCLSKHNLFSEDTNSQNNLRIATDLSLGAVSTYMTPGNAITKIITFINSVVMTDITTKLLYSVYDIGTNDTEFSGFDNLAVNAD